MFEGINHFGLRLLAALIEQKGFEDISVSPPAIYLPLAMLRGAASGATRAGLSRLLGSSESLTDEERERKIRALRSILTLEHTTFEVSVKTRGQRPFSPTFLRRAQESYGAQLYPDDSNLPLRLLSQLNASLNLDGTVAQVEADPLVGFRLPSVGGRRSLSLLVPRKARFWQGKNRPLQDLFERLNDDFFASWQGQLMKAAPEKRPAMLLLPALPLIVEAEDLLPHLKELDMGPAITPSADFSLMMVSGEAPHIATLRHTLQVPLSGFETGPDLCPLFWWITDEPSELIVALGVRWSSTG
ncbi:serpin family protein [Armatimonas sp.]|uniref:serpin family protein n=1 Tax=Armatimonas sp. TaxID=1872638 RepID=UPI00286CA338|nr:serpin family protein [Armatimonas sp.]